MNLVKRYPFKKLDKVHFALEDVMFWFFLPNKEKTKRNAINISVL